MIDLALILNIIIALVVISLLPVILGVILLLIAIVLDGLDYVADQIGSSDEPKERN